MNPQKILFGITFLLVGFLFIPCGFAQQDSLRKKRPTGVVGKYYSSLNYISLRTGVGLQKDFYSELGISYHNRYFGCTGFAGRSKYISLEFIPNFQANESQSKNVYALKTGLEVNAMLLVIGLEAKYQTDFTKNAFVVTPKIGLGIFGDVLLYYGYNFSTRQNREQVFPFISNHQFSLIFNIQEDFLSIR